MPEITRWETLDGAQAKAERLGLLPLLDEIRKIVTGFRLEIAEQKQVNSAGAVREMIDDQFKLAGGWTIAKSGKVDWKKCLQINGTSVCVGVEVQVSGRSDLVAVDLIHIRKELIEGRIDLGVLIVPDDELSYFLTDRTPNYSETERHLDTANANHIPLFIVAFKHDGFGRALPKKRTNTGKLEE